MIRYIIKENKNKKSSAFGKWYAFPVVEQTVDLADLAHHMEQHNSGFSEALCLGVLKAMVRCIKEQILEGKNVKIDDLAIFSCGIRNREGAASETTFNTQNNIAGVKLRARATGVLRYSNLNLEATIRRANAVAGTPKPAPTGGDTTNGGGTNDSGTTPTTSSPTNGSTPGGGGAEEDHE
jgi:nucleoid DNA-binding protein